MFYKNDNNNNNNIINCLIITIAFKKRNCRDKKQASKITPFNNAIHMYYF